MEISIEFDKPAFINVTKAFDRVRLSDVIDTLKGAEILMEIVKVIKALNSNITTHILVNNRLTKEILISTRIRQRDSLISLLYNLIMDKII